MASTSTLTTAPAIAATTSTVGADTPRTSSNTTSTPPATSSVPSRASLHELYALPAPIKTFPLPTFNPSNPVSLAQLAYVWLKQVISPPPSEPSVIHTGIWDPETRSVNVTDPVSVRALWEQGFFGKGSLSRSEPNWQKRELNRRESRGKTVSEQRTEARREERRAAKWERAKAELEAIERQRQEEAARAVESRTEPPAQIQAPVAEPVVEAVARIAAPIVEQVVQAVAPVVEPVPEPDTPKHLKRKYSREEPQPPVGPAELLALPNSRESLPTFLEAVGCADQPRSRLNPAETLSLAHPIIVSPQPQVKVARSTEPKPPVGPVELLALPNSLPLLPKSQNNSPDFKQPKPPVCPLDLLALPNSLADLALLSPLSAVTEEIVVPEAETFSFRIDGHEEHPLFERLVQPSGMPNSVNGTFEVSASTPPASDNGDAPIDEAKPNGISPIADGIASPPPSLSSASGSVDHVEAQGAEHQPLKRRKSVRFSPLVESTTFQHHDPPSPNHSAGSPPKSASPTLSRSVDSSAPLSAPVVTSSDLLALATPSVETPIPVGELPNKEHFQLAPEEAFFLVFTVGALKVLDPVTLAPIPTEDLLNLFRAHSYFPPRSLTMPSATLQPSDPFLVNYAVYHHFRSLGWVPRHGVKFGVDFILYQRGPVFDHSEFGVMVMPSYSDALWEEHEHEAPKKSWSWLMGVNRVLSHVLKALVLVYVDIPPPPVFDEAMKQGGIAAALKKYAIREVMVRRFSINRNR